ncbi:hypothetical protein NE237_001618 [Protea cynaroides]|uniref:Agenet domain-containing protein n=1 Tax=Protea cynaroides TaxID=273540 RepID=A0A9Q0QYJ5_9MAGN|nr:hypothetical protein NE237_001618 [Protea cynaroides]
MMQFRVGDEVEVFFIKKSDFFIQEVSGWVLATILKVYGSAFAVETRTQLKKINRTKLFVRASRVRPQPPSQDELNFKGEIIHTDSPPPPLSVSFKVYHEYHRILEEGQMIEMRVFNDLWVHGKVWEVYYHGTIGTNNISYSVQAIDVDMFYRLKEYLVSRSEVRVRREWVDGEWVPPPHLPPLHLHHHHQQVDPSFKSRDSSPALRNGPSLEQWRTAALQRLGIGGEVEIFLDFTGGWKQATIEGFRGDQIKVKYDIWSWIKDCYDEINQFYDVSLVRPLPPVIEDKKITFNLHQEVEVYHSYSGDHLGDEGWYVGEVLEIYEEMFRNKILSYTISHPKLGMTNADTKDVRVRQEWVDDKWIQYMEKPLKQRKMEEPQLVGADVEVYSLYYRKWILGTILESIENQIVVIIETKLYGECEITKKLLVDESRVRPRLLAEKDNNLIYKENEAVEVFSENGRHWIKGEIWEIHDTRTNLFYFVKTGDCFQSVDAVSKSEVRTRREWREAKWSDSSSCVQCSSSRSSPELTREANALYKRMRPSLELVRGADALDKRMRSTISTVVRQRKFEYAQFYIGAMVEVLIVHRGGWEPGTILEIQENKIKVMHSWPMMEWFHDEERVRPKLQLMEEESHRIFQLHDEVEILKMKAWYVGRILEVLRREDELIYFVSHPTSAYVCITNNDEIRIHKEWRDGEWIQPFSDSSAEHHQMLKETNIEEPEFNVGVEVEVYSLKTHEWSSATILQPYRNHIEVDVLINRKKWIMHVDASRIRPPRPEMENDQKFNWGDFIEVRSGESWRKGEIWNIYSMYYEENNIIYTILQSKSCFLLTALKSEMRALWNWIDGKWILPSFGTSLQSDKKHTSEIPKCVASFSQQQSLQACKTIYNVEITDQHTRLGATTIKDEQHIVSFPTSEVETSSSIKKKPTRTKTDIAWKYCIVLDNPNGKRRILECIFCKQRYAGGGIYRMKEHLGGKEKGDARACPRVPEEVCNAIRRSLEKIPLGEKVKQRGYASKDNQQSKHNLHTSTKSHNKTGRDPLATENGHGTPISRNREEVAQDDATISCQEPMQVPTIQSSSSPHITYEKIITNDGIGEEGKECINSAIKEGNTKSSPTSNDVYSTLVDGWERSVEIISPIPDTVISLLPDTDHIAIVASQVNDEFMIDKIEEVIDVDIGQRDSQEKNKVIIEGKEHIFQRGSRGEFIPKYEASKVAIPTAKSSTDSIADHASLIEVEEFTHVNQHVDVQKYKIPTNVVAEITQENQQVDVERYKTPIDVVEEITQGNQQVDVQVSTNETSTFDLICSRYGDVFRNCIVVGENARRFFSGQMCEVVQQMQVTTYDNTSKDMIDKWYEICSDHKAVKIENQWLMSRIEQIKKEIDAKMDAEQLLSKRRKLDAECEQILSNRSKLDAEYEQLRKKLKSEYEQSGKKLDAEYEQLLSEREKLIEEVAIVNSNRKIEIDKSKVSYPSKSMIDDLL